MTGNQGYLRLDPLERSLLVKIIGDCNNQYEQRRDRESCVVCECSAQTLCFVFQALVKRLCTQCLELAHADPSIMLDACKEPDRGRLTLFVWTTGCSRPSTSGHY